MTRQSQGYLQQLYCHGMAEFAYRNQLTRALRPTFRFSHPEPDAFSAPPLSQTPLVAMGGGKDLSCSTN